MKKLISMVIPIYNEEENIPQIYKELVKTFQKIEKEYDYELIFVNDGSTDKSAPLVEDLAEKDKRVKYLEFSRNFGKEIATTAGLYHAKGNAAMMIDADLQFPPEFIPEFLEKWQAGNEVVTGIRKRNKGEGAVKKYGSLMFNKFIQMIGDRYVIPQATDFRLLDRKVIDVFNTFTERNRITRGLIDWLGFKRDFVYFNAAERLHGEAKYNFKKLIGLAMASFVSLSSFPLKFAGYLGTFLVLVFGTFGLFILIEKFILKDPLGLNFSGPAILAVINLFSIGIILMCLGLISLYIEQIHAESINRPIFVIRKKENISEKN